MSGARENGKAKILIVDDVETNRAILEEIIKNMGSYAVLAENGKQALEMIQKEQSRRPSRKWTDMSYAEF